MSSLSESEEYSDKLTTAQYIERRLDDQIDWFNQKSAYNQKLYKRLKKTETACTIVLPVIGIIPFADYGWNKIGLVVLGAIATYIRCWSNIETYYELWTKYRTACELLKKEKFLYQTHTGIYREEDARDSVLVEQVERILAAENSQWNAIIQSIPTALYDSQSSTRS